MCIWCDAVCSAVGYGIICVFGGMQCVEWLGMVCVYLMGCSVWCGWIWYNVFGGMHCAGCDWMCSWVWYDVCILWDAVCVMWLGMVWCIDVCICWDALCVVWLDV